MRQLLDWLLVGAVAGMVGTCVLLLATGVHP